MVLEAYRLVPEREIKKIDDTTSKMMENGLYQFYKYFSEYLLQLHHRTLSNENDDEIQVLTMDQLKRPMMVILGLWGLAMAIFIMEHIIRKWKEWRGTRIQYLDPKYKPKRIRQQKLFKRSKLSKNLRKLTE